MTFHHFCLQQWKKEEQWKQQHTIILSTSLFWKTHRLLVYMFAPFRRCHNGGGVGLPEGHMSMWQRSSAEGPRCVHVGAFDPLQLRYPPPYVVTLKQMQRQHSGAQSKIEIFILMAIRQNVKGAFLRCKQVQDNSSCIFSHLHYCRSRGLAWSCWTSCSLWGHFLFLRCTASFHSCCRHHGQSLEKILK